jgi:hypothetical protein
MTDEPQIEDLNVSDIVRSVPRLFVQERSMS